MLVAAVAGAAAFLAVGLAAAGFLGYLLEPEPFAPRAATDSVDAVRRLGFAQVLAGFAGAVAGGLLGALICDRSGLVHRARRAGIVLGPLVLGVVWLAEVAPNAAVFAAGLALYAMGAALGAALAGTPAES